MATLLTETYGITKNVGQQSVTITVEISKDDEVTIQTIKGHAQFVFTRSDKDLVKAMALALHEAGDLVDSRKVTAG